MPPVAITPSIRFNGQTARDASMRPLQTCRKFAFPQLLLTFRLFVGRGLDPSLPFCGNRQIPRRGGVTPPYIPLYKNVSAQRTLLISTLNSKLSTLSVRAARAIKISPTVAMTTDKSLQKWYSTKSRNKIPFGCNTNLLLFLAS